ncbi:MAG: hypothetical protein IIC60_13310, partial [Proteobacteria bacterium]|nr:hypothetical protein [Pseudomonadota bacterium]
ELTPENTGGLLRAGSTLALQLHYATIGRTTVDESEIGFWFYDEDNPPEDRMVTGCTCLYPELWQEIPAFSANHILQAEIIIGKDAYLYSILPQMHYRGKSMLFTAHYPDGYREEIINIANYNYNWQISYNLAQPKFLPGGTKIVTTATYDNSSRNKFNPDSSRNVPWGQESWNELLVGVLTWKYAD